MSQVSKLVPALINEVEQAILDLADYSISVRSQVLESIGVPIQPLRDWKNQHAVLAFKDILASRFDKVIKIHLDK